MFWKAADAAQVLARAAILFLPRPGDGPLRTEPLLDARGMPDRLKALSVGPEYPFPVGSTSRPSASGDIPSFCPRYQLHQLQRDGLIDDIGHDACLRVA